MGEEVVDTLKDKDCQQESPNDWQDLISCLDGVKVGRRPRSLNGEVLDAVCFTDSDLLDFVCHGNRAEGKRSRILG